MMRSIPKDYNKIEFPEVAAKIYTKESNNILYAMAFSGKRSKPDFNYRFKTIEWRDKHIQDYIDRLKEVAVYKAKRKEKRVSFVHSLKVGDILSCSWGYDQTNVDFYQVAEVIGKMVKIREIECSMPNGEEGFMTGFVIPLKDRFANKEPMLKKVLNGNSIKINSFAWANIWDGKPERTSWYG